MKIIDLDLVVNTICQDCNECDHKDCPYDCDFIETILAMGREMVYCKDCMCYDTKTGTCNYYKIIKPETGYCNAGICIEEN